MNRLLARLRTGARARQLAETTFCEACNQVCTPERQLQAQIDHYRDTIQREGLIRF